MGLDKTENVATSEAVINPEDIKSIVGGINGHGVISGLAVSQRGAGANMSVDVASGTAIVNGTTVTKGSTTNVVIQAAHATNDRNDVISIDSSGTITATKGDDSVDGPRLVPATPANEVRLAVVYVLGDVANTTITDSEISDARILEKVYQEALDSGMFNTADGLVKLDGSADVPLAQIPATLTGKDADTLDGKHASNTANNVPILDGSADVPLAQIPDTLTGKKTNLNAVVTTGSYTGDDTNGRAIAHGLGRTPKMIIWQGHSGGILWQNRSTYHQRSGTEYLVTAWNSTNVYVGSGAEVNGSYNNVSGTYYWVAIG